MSRHELFAAGRQTRHLQAAFHRFRSAVAEKVVLQSAGCDFRQLFCQHRCRFVEQYFAAHGHIVQFPFHRLHNFRMFVAHRKHAETAQAVNEFGTFRIGDDPAFRPGFHAGQSHETEQSSGRRIDVFFIFLHYFFGIHKFLQPGISLFLNMFIVKAFYLFPSSVRLLSSFRLLSSSVRLFSSFRRSSLGMRGISLSRLVRFP